MSDLGGLFPDAPVPATPTVKLALARKYRPKTFSEVVGQDHVVRALTNALAQGRLHHAYLLTGTRGVGKTTLARIIAKALNCETGVTPTPCGVCAACREIDAGRFVDLIEIDAASNTGVDNMRELIENAVYAPTAGRFKVYIIDEVHMLSKGAFNAMLKTLEEPPPHVKFILATTDPQKIPVTVLSRCLQFGLKHISPPVIAAQLAKVLDAEQVAHEAAALPVIARAAAGSMRDSLSLLDQAIAFGSGAVRDAQVREMIGLVDARWLHALLEALADGDGAALMAQADALLAEGLDFETVLQSLASLLHRVAMAQVVPAALADDEPDRDAVLAMAARFDAEAVQLHYQIALRGRADLDLAPDAYTGFTMTLLRMLAFRIDDGSAPGGATRQGEGGRPAPRSTGAGGSTALPDAGGASTARTATAAAPEPEPAAPRLPVLRPDAWPDCVATLGLSGMPLVLAEHTWLRSFDDGHLALGAPESKRALVDSVARDRLEAALRERLGSIRVEVSVEPLPPEADTVASRLMRAQDAARRAAHDAIERDPFVQAALETLNARIRPGSVRPVVASDPRGEARP